MDVWRPRNKNMDIFVKLMFLFSTFFRTGCRHSHDSHAIREGNHVSQTVQNFFLTIVDFLLRAAFSEENVQINSLHEYSR